MRGHTYAIHERLSANEVSGEHRAAEVRPASGQGGSTGHGHPPLQTSVSQAGGGLAAGEAGLGSYPTTTAKTRSTTATWNCPKPCGAVMGRVDATPVAALQDAANNAHIMHMSQHTLGIHNPPEIIYLGNIIWGVTELISLLSKREAIGAKGG